MDFTPPPGGELLLHLLKHGLVPEADVLEHTAVSAAMVVHVNAECFELSAVYPQVCTLATTNQLFAARPHSSREKNDTRPARCYVCWSQPFASTTAFSGLARLGPAVEHIGWSALVDGLCDRPPPRSLFTHTYLGVHRFLTLLGDSLPDLRDLHTLDPGLRVRLEAHVSAQRARLAAWQAPLSTRLSNFWQRRSQRRYPEALWWTRCAYLSMRPDPPEDVQAALAAFGAAEDVQVITAGAHAGQLLARIPRSSIFEYEKWDRGAHRSLVALTARTDLTAEHVQAALALEPDLERYSLTSAELLTSVHAAMSPT